MSSNFRYAMRHMNPSQHTRSNAKSIQATMHATEPVPQLNSSHIHSYIIGVVVCPFKDNFLLQPVATTR